jgi:predicted Zn-dependent peptidase
MGRQDWSAAEAAAQRALAAVPADTQALEADKLWRAAVQAVQEIAEGRRQLQAGRWDDAVAAVQRARGLYTPVPGASELLQQIASAREAAEQLRTARDAAAAADWPAAGTAAAAALEAGSSDPDAPRIRDLAQRGVQLAAADAELPHAQAKAIRRLLPNGVEVLVMPAKLAHGQVRVTIAVRGAGSAHDRGPLAGTGIAALTRRLLSPAATAQPKRSRIEARGMLQALDAQVSGDDGKDHLRLGVTAPADNLELVVRLVAGWVRAPTLPVADYHAVRDELRTMVYRRSKERWAIEWHQLSSAVWGAHPWSDEAEGSVPGLDRLTRRAVVDYHAAVFTPRRLVVVIAGDCDAAAALRLAGEAFGGLQGAEQPVTPLPPLPAISLPDRIQRAVPGLESATVFFAWRTVAADHADRPALDAAASVLGRIAAFRLAQVVAAGEGRTAQARHWSEVQLPGLLYLGVRCAPGDVAAVERGVAAAVHSLVEQPPTAAELRAATALIRPALPSGAAALEPLCADLLRTTLFTDAPRFWTELPTSLRALKPGDVARVARDLLADERRLTLVLLPAD